MKPYFQFQTFQVFWVCKTGSNGTFHRSFVWTVVQPEAIKLIETLSKRWALTPCTGHKWEDIVWPLFCDSLYFGQYCLLSFVSIILRHLCLVHGVRAKRCQNLIGWLRFEALDCKYYAFRWKRSIVRQVIMSGWSVGRSVGQPESQSVGQFASRLVGKLVSQGIRLKGRKKSQWVL